MLDIALRTMWQRRTRTLLTIAAIAMSTMLFLVMSTSSAGLQQMDGDSVNGFLGKMFVTAPSDRPDSAREFPPVSSSLTESRATALLDVPGVDRRFSAPMLITPLAASLFTGGPPAVIAVGIPAGEEAAFYGGAGFPIGSGNIAIEGSIVLGSVAAAMYGAAEVGDTVTLQCRPLAVAGIAAPTGSISVDGMVMMEIDAARSTFGRSGVTTVLLAAASGGEDALAHAIRERFGELDVMTVEDGRAALASSSPIIDTFTGLFGITVLVVAGVVTLMVMLMSVGERTREFGMLGAIGARRGAILAMVLQESVVVCLVGSLIGISLAYVLTNVVFEAWVAASPAAMGQAALFMTTIDAIAGLLPAYRSARIQPIEAIGSE